MGSKKISVPKNEYERMKRELETLKKIKREVKEMEKKKEPVSLKGMGEILVSEEELDEEIDKARSSLSKGAKDVLCN